MTVCEDNGQTQNTWTTSLSVFTLSELVLESTAVCRSRQRNRVTDMYFTLGIAHFPLVRATLPTSSMILLNWGTMALVGSSSRLVSRHGFLWVRTAVSENFVIKRRYKSIFWLKMFHTWLHYKHNNNSKDTIVNIHALYRPMYGLTLRSMKVKISQRHQDNLYLQVATCFIIIYQI